ncbi:MAG: COX15/CtaA family protein [Methylacidiphilales bacterium]|nr:COX15/CtaA family protein [Candidatus Methylacidiphilales bacterium]MDW8349514.1 COX15/CtaA family protein [Verrucomicrobiae bacterium]
MLNCATPWWKWVLSFWAGLLFVGTLALIGIGGMVTSTGSGLAVPDWPTSYGYNMFLFPYERWVGGVWIEHVHRLWAASVGLASVIFAIGVSLVRLPRSLQWTAWGAVVLVVGQGVLGGYRVILVNNHLGWIHGCVAQVFLLVCLGMALKIWGVGQGGRLEIEALENERSVWRWRRQSALVLISIVFLQLVVGAAMRHEHAGLAVPDFPTAYGEWWPAVDAKRLALINEERHVRGWPPTTIAQIHLHMTHRLIALIITGLGAWWLWKNWRRRKIDQQIYPMWRVWNGVWGLLLILQLALGAMTVWSGKAALIATMHVVTGALLLCVLFVKWWIARALEARLTVGGDRL